MLKLIPQEEPDKNSQRHTKSKTKPHNQSRKKSGYKGKQANGQPKKKQRTNSKNKKCVLTNTYEQLLTYANEPDKHTDREISDIILSMHRSILHLEQARLKKRKKRRGK